MEGIYLHRAQRKVQTYIHDPSGFLIHDTSDQEVKGFVACVTGHHFATAECFFYCFPEHGIFSIQKACICWDIL